MSNNKLYSNPRVIVIQKLYSFFFNKNSKIDYPRHRYKKFIKQVVNGTIEREELIQGLMNKELKNDINDNKTELMIKLMIMAAIYEFMFMHKNPVKVIISEYLKVSDSFIKSSQKNFLNEITLQVTDCEDRLKEFSQQKNELSDQEHSRA